ncbi:MAG: metallophosphoesterase, partial [Clostridia bacterium]|nr:metallophosphoesterase [Deltaproteobacteria bacterium]
MNAFRVLVISDIHLGEDLYAAGEPGLEQYVRALNRELADFIAGNRKVSGLTHLVINGDMFDFVKLARMPLNGRKRRRKQRPPQPMTAEVSATAISPLEAEGSEIVARLQHIVEVHAPLFEELALFILAGHRVTIIEGNHDAECYLREVRSALRASVMRFAHAWQDSRSEARCDASVFAEGLTFRTWFEADVADGLSFHIEHGHQYDEF